jgi:uncharacterized membrane protein
MLTPETENHSPSVHRLILGGLFLFAIALRLYGFDRTLGGKDEAEMLLYFGYRPVQFIVSSFFESSNHIFHSVMTQLMVQVFGPDNEMGLRLPVFILGILCLWIIYRTALLFSRSTYLAYLALLMAVVNPTHIFYSQHARGYSFIMFFSIVVVYAIIRILENRRVGFWVSIFIICGFLSVYTIPTNALFILSLAIWVSLILTIPSWREEFHLDDALRLRMFKFFFGAFLAVGLLSILVFAPLKDQIAQVAQYRSNHAAKVYGAVGEPVRLFFILFSVVTQYIFKGGLHWFFPLILIGVIWGNWFRKSYRWLPVLAFILPFSSTLVTGVAAYSRNYLFNFPLLVIFMASGFICFRNSISARFKNPFMGKICVTLLTIIFSGIAFSYTLKQHSIYHLAGGQQYKQKIEENLGKFDLGLIANSRHFLYARTPVVDRIDKILQQNRLDGVKWVTTDFKKLDLLEILDSGGPFKIFSKQFIKKDLQPIPVKTTLQMFNLTYKRGLSAIPKRFDDKANWRLVEGKGELINYLNHKAVGPVSLGLRAGPKERAVAEAKLPEPVNLDKDSLAIMFWCGSRKYPSLTINRLKFHSFSLNMHEQFDVFHNVQGKQKLRMGHVNTGLPVFIHGESSKWFQNDFEFNVLLGRIPAGTYEMSLELNASPGQTENYDCLRLFFIEARTKEKKNGFFSFPPGTL